MPRTNVPQAIATLCVIFGFGAAPAVASERSINPIKDYARILRVINPHLPDWQRRKYAASVLANAERTRIDPRFIMAIVTVESSWRANAVSRSGARGLGQLMPGTAARLDVNARDAAENLRGTANYLKSLLDRFRGQQHWFEKAIAGYNAGPSAVKRYGGIPPYAQTRRYVVKVLRVYEQLYGSVGIAWTPYVSHRRVRVREVAGETPSAASNASFAAIPVSVPSLPMLAVGALAADAFQLAPIPAFRRNF